MKLVDTLIISGAVGFCLMGFHQAMSVGIRENYYIFMFSIGLLFWYQLRRSNRKEAEEKDQPVVKTKKSKKKK